jgi:hypothetical protein
MSTISIEALLLQLASIHLVPTHHEFMGMIEFVRALGSSYRLAASEPERCLLYGRLGFNFCRGAVMWLARYAAAPLRESGMRKDGSSPCAAPRSGGTQA